MPLLLRIGLVLAAMLTGGVAAVILFPPRATPAETDDADESARRERLATEQNGAASVAFQTALDGLPRPSHPTHSHRRSRRSESRRPSSRSSTKNTATT